MSIDSDYNPAVVTSSRFTDNISVDYYNKYLVNGKTYQPLYTYYIPGNWWADEGYYSPTYLATYFDGYGYNFFTGEKGYYQDSISATPDTDGISFFIVFILILFATFALTMACWLRGKYKAKQDARANTDQNVEIKYRNGTVINPTLTNII